MLSYLFWHDHVFYLLISTSDGGYEWSSATLLGIEQKFGWHPQCVGSWSGTMVGNHPLAYRTGGVSSWVVLNMHRAEWQWNRRMEFWNKGRLEEGWGQKKVAVGWVHDRSVLRQLESWCITPGAKPKALEIKCLRCMSWGMSKKFVWIPAGPHVNNIN